MVPWYPWSGEVQLQGCLVQNQGRKARKVERDLSEHIHEDVPLVPLGRGRNWEDTTAKIFHCSSSPRAARSVYGNAHGDWCLPELISQIFPAIQSLVISLSIFYQFQNKLTTIATFFTWQKRKQTKKWRHSFLPISPSTAEVEVSLAFCGRFAGSLLAV